MSTNGRSANVGSTLRRAGGYAAVSLIAVLAAVSEAAALVGFAVVAILAAMTGEGRLFRLFADQAEFKEGRLLGLFEFATVAALLAAPVLLDGYPTVLYVGTVLLVGFGYLGAEIARLSRADRLSGTVGFITGGVISYAAGHALAGGLGDVDVALIGALAMAGALVGALLRAAMWTRHDGILMLLLAGILWMLYWLPAPSGQTVAVAIGVSIVLAYVALLIGVASVAGMTTGVLAIFVTLVYGGVEWVTMLMAFFGIGGLATKYRYHDKRARGVAEANRGARGTGNVLGNTLVALVAVVGYAAVVGDVTGETLFAYAFAGAMATALADTLSSEIGSLYDDPILITSLDRVAPGTDGAITLQGTAAGAIGAAVVGAVFVALGPAGLAGGLVVLVAGTAGMLADSLLGAVIEGQIIGNHGVNAAATLVGAVLAAVAVGVTLV